MSFKTKIDEELYSMHKTNADETDSRAANVINLLTTKFSLCYDRRQGTFINLCHIGVTKEKTANLQQL